MRFIMGCIIQHNIHIPSTFRLLRLIVAKRCERGENCCAYNKEKPAYLKSWYRPHATYICQKCSRELSRSIRPRGNEWISQALKAIGADRTKVLTTAIVEKATNEKVGPLVLFDDIEQVMETVNEEQRQSLFVAMMDRVRFKGIQEGDRDRSELYEVAYRKAESRYLDHVKGKYEVQEKKAKAKKDLLYAKRKSKSEALLCELRKSLEEIASDTKTLAVILEGTWNPPRVRGNGIYHFSNWPSRKILGPLLASRGKSKVTTIESFSKSVHELYSKLDLYIGCEWYSQLNSALSDTNMPAHQKAFLKYILSKYTAGDLSKKFLSIDDYKIPEILKLINASGPETSLEIIFAIFQSPDDLRNTFVESVTENAKQAILATNLWNCHEASQGLRMFRYSICHYGDDYNYCKDAFDEYIALIEKYKSQPETTAWLEEKTRAPNPHQTFSRMVSLYFVL